jgi:hypothetical protein
MFVAGLGFIGWGLVGVAIFLSVKFGEFISESLDWLVKHFKFRGE